MKSSSFLKYRNVWLGIAMIWMIWHHTMLPSPLPGLIHLKTFGYGGVDICLFASGIGCYFSLSKNPDPYCFMKRRFSRLVPAYFCFIAVWIIYKAATVSLPLQAVIGNILGIQNLTALGNDFNWYISAILLFYFFAPFWKSLADSTRGLLRHLLIIALWVLVSVPFWNSNIFIITVARIPIFYVGILFGKMCSSRSAFSKREIGGIFAAFAVGLVMYVLFPKLFAAQLWSHGLYWYPFILITPGLCMAISFVMELLDRHKWSRIIVAVPEKVGQYSFEAYLVHVIIFDILKTKIYAGTLSNKPYLWFGTIPCIIAGSIALHYAAIGIRKLCSRRAKISAQ